MSILQKLKLEEVKQTELEILLEFNRFCENNKLRYLLAFGTALGAARHGGFIPWDDDIDVIMPRKDYERFLATYPENSSNRYKLTSYRDKSSIYHFAKLIDTTTLVYETYLNPKYSTGLWIDVFPIDRVPLEAHLENKVSKVRRLFRLRELAVGNPDIAASKSALIAKKLTRPIATALNPYSISKEIDSVLVSLNKDVPDNSADFGWVCLDNPKAFIGIFPDHDLFPAQVMEFEGHKLPVPHNIDANLTQCYGDWHQLPPKEEREPHFTEAYRL